MSIRNKFLILFLAIAISFITNLLANRYSITTPMEDLEYKKSIIQSSKNLNYKLENLRPLVGPNELEKFIKNNDNNPEIYTPSQKNKTNGTFRANLHAHTTNSDGLASTKFLMDQAEAYAKKNQKGPMYLAITDHNTVLGAKEVIKILQKNPEKYKNIKIVVGMEIFTSYKTKIINDPIEIHVLSWCINPYNKELNKEFYKKNLKDKWNRTRPDRDFDEVITYMSDFGLIGIAHPARYLKKLGNKKEAYLKELFERYKSLNKNKILFTEGYYQTYKISLKPTDGITKDLLNYINNEAKHAGVYRTGSTDIHGYSLFSK